MNRDAYLSAEMQWNTLLNIVSKFYKGSNNKSIFLTGDSNKAFPL